ncbi:HAD-IA family hydrolase [Herbiconiux daphne]|uniref:HAD-IA family hydrolase n=1 Tax=Herbiconiux daphne TaxID=2970914 RepID=A0ABT2H8C4_9MICO|nr:HAD-IA family hydrolase [Herbiconiux daphne]MCS5736188.1 HAD-IA family hydrolase [Herbiconiux daphne]
MDSTPRTELHADAVVFDMDGTLVDSTELVERVWAAFVDRHAEQGIDLAELLAFAHGRRAGDTVSRFLPADTDVEAAVAGIHADETGLEGGVAEVPGAGAFVAAFAVTDVALVTSAGRSLAALRMGEAGIPVPAVLIGADDVTEGKPSPEGYRRAIELLGRAPERVVIFEDADAGLVAARASGAQVVVVGAYEGDSTAGLPRIPDYTRTRVHPAPDGGYRITLG